MIFETERLIVRKFTEADAADALEMYSHPEVMRFLPNRNSEAPTVERQAATLVKHTKYFDDLNDGTGYWAIELKGEGKVIGASLLKALPGHDEIEVGWHQNPAFWGKGYATEAGRGAVEYGFGKLGLKRIVAVVLPDNTASIAVTQRLGMTFEGMVTAYELDLNLYSLSAPG